MKVLLSHGYFISSDEKEQGIMKPYPPLGILSIAAWLDRHNVQNMVFDSTFESEKALMQCVESYEPQVVALYANLMTKPVVLKVAKRIKSLYPNILLVFGGPDLRYNALNYLKHGEADYLIIGEGEQTLVELLHTVKNKTQNFESISGLAFLKNEKLVTTPERVKLKSLDDLPSPARHKVNLDQYLNVWQKNHGYSSISVSTQRGCPYTCKWCSTAVYGQSYRRRNAEHVVNELAALKNQYATDRFWFVDDVFTVSHKWLESFANELKKQNTDIKYECITRADRINENVIQLLKESGCVKVWIGAESGSQRIIDKMDRRVDVQVVSDRINQCKQVGIEAGTFLMLGYPTETFDDIKQTRNHLLNCVPSEFTVTLAYPIKGTELYNEIESQIKPNHNWSIETDREYKFDRTYSDKFYRFAISWIYNSVELKRQGYFSIKSIEYLVKSIMSRVMLGMLK